MLQTMHQSHSPDHRGVGFTLIEILVVIAILSLLISILLPGLTGARESARNAVCMSALRQFGVGVRFYGDDNNQLLVPAGTGVNHAFDVLLDPYLNTLPATTNTNAKKGGLWTCPADHIVPNPAFVQYQRRSYGMNLFLTVPNATSPGGPTVNLDTIPGRVVTIGDCWEAVIGTRSELGSAQVYYAPSALSLFKYASNLFGNFHFNSSGNYLFSDGSAESYSVQDLTVNFSESKQAAMTAPRKDNGSFLWE